MTPKMTVLAGDSRALMSAMAEKSVHSIITDPPYGSEFSTDELDQSRGDLAHRHAQFSRSGAGLPRYGSWMPTSSPEAAASVLRERQRLQAWHGDWLTCAHRVLRPGGWLLAFAASQTYHRLAVAAEETGFEVRGMVVWLCGQGWPKSKASLRPAIEPILLARKPFSEYGIDANKARWGTGDIDHGFAKQHTGRTASDVLIAEDVAQSMGDKAAFFYSSKVTKNERVAHPTQKPVDVFRYLMALVTTQPDHLVLDPFCGSGSSGVAADQLGVSWLGMELQPEYVEIARARIARCDGQPILQGT